MSPTSWTSKEDEVLIDFVRSHEAIYNVKSKPYRQTEIKQHLWREIGEVLNRTDADCSKRWCYIRDYYVRRRAKPGASSGEAAKRRAALLSFLDSFPSAQRTRLTYGKDENSEDNSEDMDNTDNNSEITQNGEESEETQPPEIENFVYDNNECHNMYRSNQPLTEDDLDENDLFFASMAKIVKKLPPYEQVKLRLEIGSLVGNAELRQLSNNPP